MPNHTAYPSPDPQPHPPVPGPPAPLASSHQLLQQLPPPPLASTQLPLPQQQPYPANHAITTSYHDRPLHAKAPEAHDRNFNMLPASAGRHSGYGMVPPGDGTPVNVKQEPNDKGYETGQCCGE